MVIFGLFTISILFGIYLIMDMGCYIMLLTVTNNDEHDMHEVKHGPYLDSS